MCILRAHKIISKQIIKSIKHKFKEDEKDVDGSDRLKMRLSCIYAIVRTTFLHIKYQKCALYMVSFTFGRVYNHTF